MKPNSILVAACALLASAAATALLAQSPRQPDGHPDLNGTWDNGSGIDFIHPQHEADGSICVSGCAPPAVATKAAIPPPAAARPPRNFPKYRPEYLAKVRSEERRVGKECA